VALASAAAVAAIVAPSASAAPANIEAGTGGGNVFSAASYAHDAGTVAQLTIISGTHNATSNATLGAQPLFSSSNISAGSTTVDGTQYLAPGVYPFSCTLHPGMNSSLAVAGTPKQKPTVTLKLKTKKLDQAVRKAEIKVGVTIAGGSGESAEINVKLGKKTIGIETSTNATRTVKVALTNKGHSALEKKSKATITATAEIPFGDPASAKGKLK
jgi:plastocyanin